MERNIKIGDCVNDNIGAYLGRVVSIEHKIAKVRLFAKSALSDSHLLKKFKVEELSLTHW